jgi:hypothetical protein
MSRHNRERRRNNGYTKRDCRTDLPKDRIAEAVHRAVCEYRGGDGFGRCLMYAAAGAYLVSHVTGKTYLTQVGRCRIRCAQDRWVEFGDPGGIRNGSFHAWVVGPIPAARAGVQVMDCSSRHGRRFDIRVIDFSSRHYRRGVEEMQTAPDTRADESGPFHWGRPEPPPYVWAHPDDVCSWVQFETDPESTNSLWRDLDDARPLLDRVLAIWRQEHRP